MKRVFVSGQALVVFAGAGMFAEGGPLNHPLHGRMPLVGPDVIPRDGYIFEGPDTAQDEILASDAVATVALCDGTSP